MAVRSQMTPNDLHLLSSHLCLYSVSLMGVTKGMVWKWRSWTSRAWSLKTWQLLLCLLSVFFYLSFSPVPSSFSDLALGGHHVTTTSKVTNKQWGLSANRLVTEPPWREFSAFSRASGGHCTCNLMTDRPWARGSDKPLPVHRNREIDDQCLRALGYLLGSHR